jgi:dTDP-4-amino-4,6-dideoxygalactose transaminase
MKIPFSPPFINEEIVNEVMDTLNSGWITSGPKVQMLELLMAEYTQLPRCSCVNSWTSGAQLVLKWWGIKPGDEVIVPAYTYAATALVVLRAGAKPVMVDINDQMVMDVEQMKKAISSKTKAVIPVDFAGWPCDYEAIRQALEDESVQALFKKENHFQEQLGRPLIIADAAHSLGATYGKKPSGLQADISIYSLHAVKNVTTAEGGVIGLNLPSPFDNEEIYSWMKLNSLNGQTKDGYAKIQGSEWRYDIVCEGLKINMPDICAAIGLAQLRQYEKLMLPERKRVALRYLNAFQNYDWAELPPQMEKLKESSYHIFPLRIKGISEKERDNIIKKIINSGVSANVHFIPLPMLSIFREKGYMITDFPVSYSNYCREISLPIYPQLSNDQIDSVVSAVVSAVHSYVHEEIL